MPKEAGKTKPTRKHISEAAVRPIATQGKECKRSKNNTLEGREGKIEEAGRRLRLRGGMSRYRPQAGKSQMTGEKRT